jgi:hypothetical protein
MWQFLFMSQYENGLAININLSPYGTTMAGDRMIHAAVFWTNPHS